jgi:TonB family protein
MPDFPFPWYLSRLRAALWERWSARSVQGTGLCAVSFSILRDGLMTDLRVASTSGDESFDYAALSAVQAAAPFAPLPDGFADSFLKVRVEFKS